MKTQDIILIGVKADIKEVDKYDPEMGNVEYYNGSRPSEDADFMFTNSEIIKSLPLKYQEKVKKGEPFMIEVTKKEFISYNVHE